MYKSGILDSKDCLTSVIDHEATVVGYGKENGKEFYILKNMWGTTWGDKGYIKLGAEEGDGICGINTYTASWPSTI